MRVVIAVHHFPPDYTGGAELRALRTATGLQARSHDVCIVCVERIDARGNCSLTWRDEVYEGIPVRRLSFDLAAAPDPSRWEYENPWVGQHLREYLARLGPDAVHLISGYLMSGSAPQAAIDLSIPVVVTLTDFWFLCPRIILMCSDRSLCTRPADPPACALCLRKEKRRYRLPDQLTGGWVGKALVYYWRGSNDQLLHALIERRKYLLSLLERADAVISPSRFLKRLFESEGVSPRRFVLMRQGLDVDRWVAAQPKATDTCLRVGYIGQIASHKGVDILVDAFCRLRTNEEQQRAQLVLYGDAEQFPRFTQRLRKIIGDRKEILLAGRFDHGQIRRIHADLDLLVVPSLWYENSPNVILEAFACGTPVVVSRLGGMTELVSDGVNGLHFEAGNAKDLARVLQRFVDEPDLRANLQRGIEPVKTVQQEMEELLEVYGAVCDRAR